MPQPCLTCAHPERQQIDAELAKGTPLSAIAKQFHLTKSCVWRHKSHLQPHVFESAEAAKNAERERLARAVDELIQSAKVLHHRAKRKRDSAGLLKAIGAISKLIELRARVTGMAEPESPELHLHVNENRMIEIAKTYLRRHASDSPPREGSDTRRLQ